MAHYKEATTHLFKGLNRLFTKGVNPFSLTITGMECFVIIQKTVFHVKESKSWYFEEVAFIFLRKIEF